MALGALVPYIGTRDLQYRALGALVPCIAGTWGVRGILQPMRHGPGARGGES